MQTLKPNKIKKKFGDFNDIFRSLVETHTHTQTNKGRQLCVSCLHHGIKWLLKMKRSKYPRVKKEILDSYSVSSHMRAKPMSEHK